VSRGDVRQAEVTLSDSTVSRPSPRVVLEVEPRELEVERIRSAMQRAEELTGDAADALEAAAAG